VQIHNAINDVCEQNKGVAVVVSASHTCACLRGIKHDGCEMKTSKLSGDFLEDAATRAEFYDFVANMKKC
jgi:GTP cyclohydrolase I